VYRGNDPADDTEFAPSRAAKSHKMGQASYETGALLRREAAMLTFVFLFFIALFAVAGIVISMSAKKRKAGAAQAISAQGTTNSERVGRANSEED
jgi:hypothetical protein